MGSAGVQKLDCHAPLTQHCMTNHSSLHLYKHVVHTHVSRRLPGNNYLHGHVLASLGKAGAAGLRELVVDTQVRVPVGACVCVCVWWCGELTSGSLHSDTRRAPFNPPFPWASTLQLAWVLTGRHIPIPSPLTL